MKTYEFFIPGPLPGLNEIIDAAKVVMNSGKKAPSIYSKMKTEWDEAIVRIILQNEIPALGSILIAFIWIEKDKRRDKDNIEAGKKFILDALVSSGIIKNDGWGEVDLGKPEFAVNKECPGVIVKIKPIERKRS